MLKHGAGAQVAQFGLDKSAQVARGTVFDAEHGMQVIVVLDDHAGTELGRWNRHCWFTSPYTLVGILGSGAGPGVPSGPVSCLLGGGGRRGIRRTSNQHLILHRRTAFWEPGRRGNL